MDIILLVVVLAFIFLVGWNSRQSRLEREVSASRHGRERSELLTRITHPELVVVPDVPSSKELLPDLDPEQDDYGLVGSIVEGLE